MHRAVACKMASQGPLSALHVHKPEASPPWNKVPGVVHFPVGVTVQSHPLKTDEPVHEAVATFCVRSVTIVTLVPALAANVSVPTTPVGPVDPGDPAPPAEPVAPWTTTNQCLIAETARACAAFGGTAFLATALG